MQLLLMSMSNKSPKPLNQCRWVNPYNIVNIENKNDLGLVGKTINLDVHELIVLADLNSSLDCFYSKFKDLRGGVKLNYDDSKVMTNDLLKVVGFLANLTEGVKSNNEVADDLFTHKRVLDMGVSDTDLASHEVNEHLEQ